MILRTLLCIPTYNNKGSIAKVVAACLGETAFPLLVIDDGSTTPVQDALQKGPHAAVANFALTNGRLRIIRFPENRGKGAAIQAAFEYGVREGFTHLLTLDGDGQHLVSEVAKLVEIARENPWDLVIGNRRLSGDAIPESTKFGRRFSNFWVDFETGASVKDSQSGFRLYPLFRVQNMRFWTRRYDFEIEVLIRLIWAGVSVREVEIECYYPPANERVSHFDKLWDNVRISALNTVLVTISLLKSHRSASGTAVALGVGVFVGCTPFFGLHTLIVAAIAVIFRMNALLLWLGSQISIPPLAPFLAVASIHLGQWLTGDEMISITSITEAASHFYSPWVLGAAVLGTALGTAVGTATYLAASGLQARFKRGKNWSGASRGGRFGNWFLKTVAQRLGLGAAYFCLYFIIPYFYLFAPKARRACNEYYRILNPETGLVRRQWLVMKHLFQFGRLLLDRIFQGFSATPRFTGKSQGSENIIAPLEAPTHGTRRGLIMLGAHLGGWDLAASLLPTRGFSSELHLLQHEAAGLSLNKLAGRKGREHVKSLPSQPLLLVRQLLAEGKPVALMGDRPVGGHFELVSFCGRLAPFDTTPFRIAAACGAPALFTFGFKGRGKNYEFYATPSRRYAYAPGEDKSLRCLAWTQDFANVLETYVRRYPDQWSNFFPFWSAVPAPPESHGGEATPKARHSSIEELRRPVPAKAALEPAPRAVFAPAPQP